MFRAYGTMLGGRIFFYRYYMPTAFAIMKLKSRSDKTLVEKAKENQMKSRRDEILVVNRQNK